MESFDRTQAEYLVYTYSDLILRLSYTYLNPHTTRRISVRRSFSNT